MRANAPVYNIYTHIHHYIVHRYSTGWPISSQFQTVISSLSMHSVSVDMHTRLSWGKVWAPFLCAHHVILYWNKSVWYLNYDKLYVYTMNNNKQLKVIGMSGRKCYHFFSVW